MSSNRIPSDPSGSQPSEAKIGRAHSPDAAEHAGRCVRIYAPAPEHIAPLAGEAEMLIALLGQAFTDLIEG